MKDIDNDLNLDQSRRQVLKKAYSVPLVIALGSLTTASASRHGGGSHGGGSYCGGSSLRSGGSSGAPRGGSYK